MTAVDTTFTTGRVGFGSFDNQGRIRDLKVTGAAVPERDDVLPSLRRNLVSSYDFEHPSPGNPAQELDQGASGTHIDLVNGGAAMRVRTASSSGHSIQTQQVNPTVNGNDDWKAGVYSADRGPGLRAFNDARRSRSWAGSSRPGRTRTRLHDPDPNDVFNAVGIAGVLTGDSEGHTVRALLEVIDVAGTPRLVALGRRVDGASSQTFAATEDWHRSCRRAVDLPGATFDFDSGEMRLYKNGRPLDGLYTVAGDPWGVAGPPEPDFSSATDPRGIKIGGSFPQNTLERNPCNCRFDSLMFLDRAATSREVREQYDRAAGRP